MGFGFHYLAMAVMVTKGEIKASIESVTLDYDTSRMNLGNDHLVWLSSELLSMDPCAREPFLTYGNGLETEYRNGRETGSGGSAFNEQPPLSVNLEQEIFAALRYLEVLSYENEQNSHLRTYEVIARLRLLLFLKYPSLSDKFTRPDLINCGERGDVYPLKYRIAEGSEGLAQKEMASIIKEEPAIQVYTYWVFHSTGSNTSPDVEEAIRLMGYVAQM